MKWNMVIPSIDSHIISIDNDRYLLLFGGSITDEEDNTNQISIINLKQWKSMKTTIKIPCYGFCVSVIQNQIRDNLIIYGYINDLWKSQQFQTFNKFPIHLINLIGQWIKYDRVHLIGQGYHWSLSVDQIFQSIQK